MIILGLTGSIGMGKTETAKMFATEGVPVFDADAEVHQLQAKDGKAIPAINDAFPGVVSAGVLDRGLLGNRVFRDARALRTLEAIIHPLVAEARRDFVEAAKAAGAPVILLDEPILFEMGGNHKCDKVVVVSAPETVQRARVLSRDGMTVEKFEHILSRQMPDREKRQRADYIIETDKGLDDARRQVKALLEDLKGHSHA